MTEEEKYIKTVNITIWSFIIISMIEILVAFYYQNINEEQEQEFIRKNCIIKEVIFDTPKDSVYHIFGKIYDCNGKTIFKRGE